MIRRNVLLILGLLALLAGTAISVIWLQQQRAPVSNGEQQPAHISVLAATHAITTGSLLRPSDVSWIEIPMTEMRGDFIARGAPNEAALNLAAFDGALTRRDFGAREPFVAEALVKKSDRSFLAAVLAPGHRALTIAVEAPQTASGLVLPGDHVDIILTQNFGEHAGDPANRAVSETVLSDVRVVAIDQSLGPSSASAPSDSRLVQESRTPRTITLELSERDAQKLVVAAQLGKIDLSVRALETDGSYEIEGPVGPVWAEDVSAAIKALKQHPAPLPPAPAPITNAAPSTPIRPSIEVFHGAKMEIR
jgi:pilus assembly protein CpaB